MEGTINTHNYSLDNFELVSQVLTEIKNNFSNDRKKGLIVNMFYKKEVNHYIFKIREKISEIEKIVNFEKEQINEVFDNKMINKSHSQSQSQSHSQSRKEISLINVNVNNNVNNNNNNNKSEKKENNNLDIISLFTVNPDSDSNSNSNSNRQSHVQKPSLQFNFHCRHFPDDKATEINSTGKFSVIEKIDEGDSYTIYKVKVKNEDKEQICAIKAFDITKHPLNLISREYNALISLQKSKYINKVIDLINPGNNHIPLLVLEYSPSLKSLISSNLNENLIFFFFVQIYFGICEMHFNGIIHRYLTLDNILFDESTGLIQITDFSSVILCDDNVDDIAEIVSDCVCPEAIINAVVGIGRIKNKLYTIKTYYTKYDVFSLGLILLRLVSGNKNKKELYKIEIDPRKVDVDEETLKAAVTNLQEEISRFLISKKLKKLLMSLLEYSNEKRIKLADIQRTKWFVERKEQLKRINAGSLKGVYDILTH